MAIDALPSLKARYGAGEPIKIGLFLEEGPDAPSIFSRSHECASGSPGSSDLASKAWGQIAQCSSILTGAGHRPLCFLTCSVIRWAGSRAKSLYPSTPRPRAVSARRRHCRGAHRRLGNSAAPLACFLAATASLRNTTGRRIVKPGFQLRCFAERRFCRSRSRRRGNDPLQASPSRQRNPVRVRSLPGQFE